MNSRKKPGVAFWATVVVAILPVLYVLSWAPAGRLRFNGVLSRRAMRIYEPLAWIQWRLCPSVVRVKWQNFNVVVGDTLVGYWGFGDMDRSD